MITRSTAAALALGAAACIAGALAATPAAAPAQEVPSRTAPAAADTADTVGLTLGDAIARATTQSQEVRLARSQVELADAQVRAARAAALPQLDAQLGYTRTIQSQFTSGGGGGFTIPDSLKFEPNADAPLEERIGYLEKNAGKAAYPTAYNVLGSLFSNLPFGRLNQYTATLSGSQPLYAGGRVGAALRIAGEYRESARLGLREQEADIELRIRSAYFNALLAQELERIAAAAVTQAEAFLTQERTRLRAGTASELDVLRAEVALENLRPQLVQARNSSSLATLDLKRLVDLPLALPVRLTTPLEAPPAESLAAPEPDAQLLLAQRAAVRSQERLVAIRGQQVRIARGAFFPSVNLNVNYGRTLFPTSVFGFNSADWRPDFTAGISLRVPLFSGFRLQAELQESKVELEQERLRLAQLRESVQLQYEQARGEKARAAADIAARQRTVDQAQRVYDLTVLRYERGLATQLEVTDARLQLLQARTNLAHAVADFYIADAGVTRALGTSSTGASTGATR
ncbi:MAG TPA: TolC family protein [Gemmatimonadaceae bacterium]|nr:TolC family protein [Gemmatimonadaceae bacterium]